MSEEKTWQEEADELLEKLVIYGFSIRQKDIGNIFMNELGLNRRYKQERGYSIKEELKWRVTDFLRADGYELRGGTLFHPEDKIEILRSLSMLPENVPVNLLWEKLRNTARAEPNVSHTGSGYSTLTREIEESSVSEDSLYNGMDFNGKHVIELGPGWNPQKEAVMNRGAASYKGTDPFVKWKEYAHKDSLSFLLEQESDSSVIISYLVQQCEMFELIFGGLDAPRKRQHYVYVERYNKNLAKEIARVLVPEGFVFHGSAYDAHTWDARYAKVGLSKDKKKEGLFWKNET